MQTRGSCVSLKITSYSGIMPRGKSCQTQEVLFSFVSTSCSKSKTMSNTSEDGEEFHMLYGVG